MRRTGLLAVVVVSAVAFAQQPARKPLTPRPEKLGLSCTADDQCTPQQLCVPEPEEAPTCHLRCAAGCFEDQRCTVLETPPSDQRYVCTDDRDRRCTACQADDDCGLPLDKCVLLTSGEKVCARDCSYDDQCPEGFVCADPSGADGKAKRRQCVPRTGCCDCQVALERWNPRWAQAETKVVPPRAPPPTPPAGGAGPATLPTPTPMWPGGYGVFVPRPPSGSSVPVAPSSTWHPSPISSSTPSVTITPSRPSSVSTIRVQTPTPAPSHPVTRPSNF